MIVEWRNIPGFSDYEISNMAEIRSRGKKFRFGRNYSNGFMLVNLIDDNDGRKTDYLHKLMAKIYLDPVEGKTIVVHIDGNTENNIAENLKYSLVSDVVKRGLYIAESKNLRVRKRVDGIKRFEALNFDQKRVLKYLRYEEKIAIYKLAILFRCSASCINGSLARAADIYYLDR